MLSIFSSIYIVLSACWWKQHASEKSSLNFFRSQNAKDVNVRNKDVVVVVCCCCCCWCYSFKLEINTKRKILKLNIVYLVEKIVRFHVDCRPQITIVYLKSQCSQWGPWIGIYGQLAVCLSKLVGFIQYNIFV